MSNFAFPQYLGADATPPAPSAASSGGESLYTYFEQIAPAIATVQDSLDPRTQVETLKARIANYRKMKQKMPALALFYDNEINRLKAKLKAAQDKLSLKQEGEAATRDWRVLGQTALTVGIVTGVALIGLIVVGTSRVGRGGR